VEVLTSWDVLVWIGGVLGLGALVAWYFQEFLKAYLPKLNPARMGRLAQQRDLPLPSGERFVVLIADLQGDDEQKSHTRHVAAALEPYKGLDVQRIGPGPEWDIGGRDDFDAEARRLLTARKGDVLVRGDVATKEKALRLRFLAADAGLRPDLRGSEGRRPGEYALTETGLPLDFDQDFNAVVVALVLAAVAPATERQGQYLVDAREPVAGRLQHLCEDMPAGLNDEQRGSLWHALGTAAATLGEQRGEKRWLETSIDAYQSALGVWTREAVPLSWATTHHNLGNALTSLGEGSHSPEQLEEAVSAYRAALEVWTRRRYRWTGRWPRTTLALPCQAW
jgi:hypothetical protein